MDRLAPPVIILHKPSLGENIGAVARAMGNFGLTELRLVQARKAWDRQRAKAAARAGVSILTNCKEYAHLPQALADLDYVVASTARRRDMVKPILTPKLMGTELYAQAGRRRRVAMLFGSEKAGLDNESMVLSDAIVHIPTCAGANSLNLAQAVILLSYSWFGATQAKLERKALVLEPATKADLQNFFDHLEAALDAAAFLTPKEKKPVMLRGLKNIFVRARASHQELRSLRGALNALLLWPHNGAQTPKAQARRAIIRTLSTPKHAAQSTAQACYPGPLSKPIDKV